ncbi:hypothetical protein [Brevundimonas naejangsanensis]|uniref:hypothetical protein n=1 Tax=Brevundimonas naejangsanensis TaxID=588932 RepID=UPI001F08C77F|nr:hypothetical protein [Brevundimonas naejangsanensis]
MTDPNIPPERVVHQTTINSAPTPRKGGGTGLALIVGGLLVAVAVIAWFVFAGGRPLAPQTPNLNVDIHMPTPRLPEVPDRPAPQELPRPTEPPSVAAPEPKS